MIVIATPLARAESCGNRNISCIPTVAYLLITVGDVFLTFEEQEKSCHKLDV